MLDARPDVGGLPRAGVSDAAHLLGGRRATRNAGVRAGQVLALQPGDAREHSGAEPAEGRAVPRHLLLSVRPSLDRRPGAPGVRAGADLDSGRDRRRRRAGLGRPGAQHALPAVPQDRLAPARRSRRLRPAESTFTQTAEGLLRLLRGSWRSALLEHLDRVRAPPDEHG